VIAVNTAGLKSKTERQREVSDNRNGERRPVRPLFRAPTAA